MTTTTKTDPRELFRRAAGVAAETIAGVSPDQLGAPTPCAELDVRALLAHLVGVVDRVAAIGRGEDAMAVQGTRAVAGDDWSAAWRDATVEAEAAWRADATLEQAVVLPWVSGTAGEALLGYVNEVVVHTWDLAQATGQTPTWDDDVIEAAYLAITATLPAEGRTALFEAIMPKMGTGERPQGFGGAPFGEAVNVPAGVAPIDRLVAYNGRNPAR